MDFITRIFKDYLDGKTKPSETGMVDAWYEQTGRHNTPAWITPKHLGKAKAEIIKNLSARLNMPVRTFEQHPEQKTIYIQRLLPYAAAVILVATTMVLMRRVTTPAPAIQKVAARQIFSTGTGIRKKLTLPDSTIVWLNNGSRLSVSLNDYKYAATREVWLDEGEAYFEVTKNPARPFLVHADSLTTRVLGTAFNIKAYRQLGSTQVLVSHGSVQVSASGSILDTLMRNRQLTWYGKSRFFVVKNTNEQDAVWWNNRFVLNGAGFKELALRLQLRFGVQLSTNNQRILQTSFSASFPDSASLQQVLQALCAIYKTDYQQTSNRILIH